MEIRIDTITSIAETDLQNKPEYVTEERWKKILRIRPLEDKKRSLLAGKLLHQMCEACGISKPVYGTVESGKPVLLSHPQIAFNVSHSGEYVVLAYEDGAGAIGVDIQQIRDVSEGVKKRILHENEVVWLERKVCRGENYHMSVATQKRELGECESLGKAEVENRILNRIWAIKESYVKMTGEGLSHDFRKLCIDFEVGIVTDENGRIARYEELDVPDGYVSAVTIKE